ncbi:MAG: cation diffusion facilitator family transporter [Saprospiraceae bacterium]
MENISRQNLKAQQLVFFTALVLFVIKLAAWYLTGSVAILTDALESTVNVIAGGVGLYSIYLSNQPKDTNHPYGHGKVEFISAAIEGTLIVLAGFFIIYEAIDNLRHPHAFQKLDYGIILIAITAIINFAVGRNAVKRGKKSSSLALEASGHHLISDTYTTIGILVGLGLLYFTRIPWIDSVTALIFAFVIIYTGFKILRSSVAGIMDETDMELMEEMIQYLGENRRENWVDLHNVRVIKYGSFLHVDCHLTVPWFLNVHQAHDEVDALEAIIREKFGDRVEVFVHTDGCLDFSCRICDKPDCKVRQHPFEKKIVWNLENVLSNEKHSLEEGSVGT